MEGEEEGPWLTLSALLIPVQPTLESVRGCRTRGKDTQRKTPHPHFSILHEARRETLCHCLSPGMPEPFPAHSRLGCQVIAGKTSYITGLRGHHLGSEEEAAPADLEGKEYSFTWLHLALISAICQHSLCCITASQSTNAILHPPARHTVSQKNQEVTFSALKETSSRLHPVAQLLYCQYHGTSLLEGLRRIISISPLNP